MTRNNKISIFKRLIKIQAVEINNETLTKIEKKFAVIRI